MAPRLELHALLLDLLESENVYFQPPSSHMMNYPCIVYNLDAINIEHANNKPYKHDNRYQIMYITRNPDDAVVDKIKMLSTIRFDRHYTADGLHHYVFNLYF